MTYPEFYDLPFNERPDLTPYLIHLTKSTVDIDEYDGLGNLISILKNGEIWGSSRKGFVKGSKKATCFMDVPFYSLKHILTSENIEANRYGPYGVFVTKKLAYKKGTRPVLYLSNEEMNVLKLPESELWRVVRFEVKGDEWISWLHEREWRKKGNFLLPSEPFGVLVKTAKEAMELREILNDEKDEFKAIPRTIIPLEIICQGLIY